MLKFNFTMKNGVFGYGFGLSEENIQRLKQGKPIVIDLGEMGGSGQVMIFYGKTEQDMQRDLAQFIGPKTKYASDPRLRDN